MNDRRIQDRRTDTVTVSLATMQRIVMAGNRMQMLIPLPDECNPEYQDWEVALAALRKETSK